jgi:Fe-S cluster assembly scaffold protein SufB
MNDFINFFVDNFLSKESEEKKEYYRDFLEKKIKKDNIFDEIFSEFKKKFVLAKNFDTKKIKTGTELIEDKIYDQENFIKKNRETIKISSKRRKFIFSNKSAVFYKNLKIVVKDKISSKIFFDFSYLRNSISFVDMEIFLGKNSKVEINFLQKNSKNNLFIFDLKSNQKDDSDLKIQLQCKGKIFGKNNFVSILNSNNSKVEVSAKVDIKSTSILKNKIEVLHIGKNCNSNQNCKHILDGSSKFFFEGIINIKKNAKNSNAYQKNDSILLCENSDLESKPTLKIFEDQVKCSHGATIGKIDQDQIFYMKSRGIKEIKANKIFLKSFLG